jgi:hypothetical protein
MAKGSLLSLLLAGFVACVDVDGGAAEFSWTLRTFEGDTIRSCEAAGLAAVDLCWRSAAITGDFETCVFQRRFECKEGRGATRFEIEPGATSMRVFPVCADGTTPLAGTYQVPAPILRTSREGQILTLNSFLIVVPDRTNPRSACPTAGCPCL